MKTNTGKEKIRNLLTRSVERIYPDKESLEKVLLSGKRIRLYCGYDPSGPTLHFGHMISLKKLAQFQELGHEVVMLIGDFTGMIGDPTDKAAARRKMTREEVRRNAMNYQRQASKFLRFNGLNPVKILYNSQWSDKLTFLDLIEIASIFTVQRMITREMFQERLKNKKPIYLHEFLYPLAQAYDSVAMDVDLEIGGNDQTFNMLCGRELMKAIKNKEKFVLTLKLLTDPSGKKMGKTEGNLIGLNETADQMYGKIMAWPDSLIGLGLELLTDTPIEEITRILNQIKKGKLNPRDAKAKMAKEIVAICQSVTKAARAEKEFNKIFKEKSLPTKIPGIHIIEGKIPLLDLLEKSGLVSSRAEARRLIFQKGIKIDNEIQADWQKEISVRKGQVIRVGKRKFVKII